MEENNILLLSILNEKRIEINRKNQYECGCFAMRSGWYKALGIDIEEEILKCIKYGNNICKIALRVKK